MAYELTMFKSLKLPAIFTAELESARMAPPGAVHAAIPSNDVNPAKVHMEDAPLHRTPVLLQDVVTERMTPDTA